MTNMYGLEVYPCKTCGKPSASPGTRECANCWEVESRIDMYLQSDKGIKNIINVLNNSLD